MLLEAKDDLTALADPVDEPAGADQPAEHMPALADTTEGRE